MRMPRVLLALIDPASAAMHSPNPPSHRPVYRGGAVFGPGVPGGSGQATQEEIATFRTRAQQRHPAEGTPAGLQPDRHAAELAARELISTGAATLHGTKGTLRAHVVRFWHGDSILQISAQDRPIESMTRIPRRLGAEHEQLITAYLLERLPGA